MPALSRLRIPGLALLVLGLLFAVPLFGRTGASAQTTASGEDLELGASLFAENCAVCHGANGEGRVGATLAQNWPSIRPDLTIRSAIERGVPGSPMPAWSEENGGPLTVPEIDALVAYILSWETGEPRLIPTVQSSPRPVISPVPEVEGDPNHGAVLYDQNCAVCHGQNLEGRVGATLAKDWPSIRPDLQIKTIITNGVQGSPMPAWSQENGGPLSETEINDLVAFVVSQADEGPDTVEDVQPTPAFLGQTPGSWLTGWGGILLAVIGFIVLVGLAIILQARQ
jgi:mono/diheme cytochrome c family protein